jgi:hypothetical protein
MSFLKFLEQRDPELFEVIDGKMIAKVIRKMPLTVAALAGTAGLGGIHGIINHDTNRMQREIDQYNKSLETEVVPEKPKKMDKSRGKVVGRTDNSGDV